MTNEKALFKAKQILQSYISIMAIVHPKMPFRQIEPYGNQSIKGKVVSVLLINPILLYLHDIKKHRRNISALFLLRFVSCLYDESELS